MPPSFEACCRECSKVFHIVPSSGNALICGRCAKLLDDDWSAVERKVIMEKSACQSCLRLYGLLEDALCIPCAEHWYARQDEIPAALAAAPGVFEQLGVMPAPSLLARSREFQSTASGPRFGVGLSRNAPVRQNANLAKATVTSISIKADRKAAKETFAQQGLKISVLLYKFSPGQKMVAVPDISVKKMFVWTMMAKAAFEVILDLIHEILLKTDPTAIRFTWDMLRVFAHESNSRAFVLDSALHAKSTRDLHQHFQNEGLGSAAAVANSEITLRFAYNENKMPGAGNDDDNDYDEPSVRRPRTAVSRKRGPPDNVDTTKKSKARGMALRSTFRPPAPLFNRDPSMVVYKFQQLVPVIPSPDCGTYTVTLSNDVQTIEIAQDWREGYVLYCDGEPTAHTGFISKGSSKEAIYARVGADEYAFLKMTDESLPAGVVFTDLLEEYKLLLQGSFFKKEFDKHAKEFGKTTSGFYWNSEGAILGKLVIDPAVDRNNTHVPPHDYFLATRLLPCGQRDAGIRKFTGSLSIGSVEDSMDDMVQAFVHFSLVYSQNTLLFCDVQGVKDVNGRYCLFDPQCHTNIANTAHRRGHWDVGPGGIIDFVANHREHCEKPGSFCSSLEVRELRVFTGDTPTSSQEQ